LIDINDTMGHHVGDFVLKRLAEEARKSLRTSDTFAGFSGEKFVLLADDLKSYCFTRPLYMKSAIASSICGNCGFLFSRISPLTVMGSFKTTLA
jgi:GGDEF domain-containing protein